MISVADGLSILTIKPKLVVPASPSSILTSEIEICAASSLLIVPRPCASVIVAPTGLERSTVKVSSPSTVVSPLTATDTVAVVAPAGIVAVPVVVT